jgi:hypothetical protein
VPGRIRTCDPRIRSHAACVAELNRLLAPLVVDGEAIVGPQRRETLGSEALLGFILPVDAVLGRP